MRRLPADHLASAYVELSGIAEAAGVSAQIEGYSTVSAALLVEPGGLHLRAVAPFDADTAPTDARESFALASEPSSLADWMPPQTQASAVFFRLAQSFDAAEQALAGQPGAQQITDGLSQLRALAAFGLGINLDDDLLPLFDSESAPGPQRPDRGSSQRVSSCSARRIRWRPKPRGSHAAGSRRPMVGPPPIATPTGRR